MKFWSGSMVSPDYYRDINEIHQHVTNRTFGIYIYLLPASNVDGWPELQV